MYCNMDMRYVDANETNNIRLNGDAYVHMVTYMLVKYIQYMHIRLTRTTMRILFGKRLGRHNATQVRESWLWGPAVDMMWVGWEWGRPGLRVYQERRRLLKKRERAVQAIG